MRRLHAVAALVTLFFGAAAATFWVLGDVQPAGITAAISGAAGLVWGYLANDVARRRAYRDEVWERREQQDWRAVWPAEAGAPE